MNNQAQHHGQRDSGLPTTTDRLPMTLRNFTEELEASIVENENLIAVMGTSRSTGKSPGSSAGSADSVSLEMQQLRKVNDEHRALVRLQKAIARRSEALTLLLRQWPAHGGDLPDEETLVDASLAERDVRAAQAEVKRLVKKA